jgi:hypothetical protein
MKRVQIRSSEKTAEFFREWGSGRPKHGSDIVRIRMMEIFLQSPTLSEDEAVLVINAVANNIYRRKLKININNRIATSLITEIVNLNEAFIFGKEDSVDYLVTVKIPKMSKLEVTVLVLQAELYCRSNKIGKKIEDYFKIKRIRRPKNEIVAV